MSVESFMDFSSRGEEPMGGSRPATRDLAKPSFGCGGLRSSTTTSSNYGVARTTSASPARTSPGTTAPKKSPLARSFDDDFDDKPIFDRPASSSTSFRPGGASSSGDKTVNDFINYNKGDDRGISSGATADKFIGGTGGFGGGSRTAAMSPGKRATHRKLAREANARIKRYLEDNDIHFAGAGDEKLSRIEDAWSIEHPDPRARRANMETLRGVGEILREYPSIHCTVHGETGQARTAPVPLAQFLRLDAQRDVLKCMDYLAEKRALACFEELVRLGIPRDQLDLTFKGNGTKAQVDFIPSDMADEEPEPPPLRGDDRELHRLRDENAKLREQNAEYRRRLDQLEASGGDYQRLKAAYDKLQAELAHYKSLHSTFEQRVRTEVARRVQVELDNERRRHEEELRRLRLDVERLEEENRRLRHDLNNKPQQTVVEKHSLDLVDILPAGLELSSLKRAEWRRLFERIVAELLKRKKTVVQNAPVQRYPAYDTYKYDVKSKVDRLWESSNRSYRPPPPPVPPPPPPPVYDRGDTAERFIAFSGGGKPHMNETDQFIEFSSGRGGGFSSSSSGADGFLRGSTSATKIGTTTTDLASDASGFLAFAGNRRF